MASRQEIPKQGCEHNGLILAVMTSARTASAQVREADSRLVRRGKANIVLRVGRVSPSVWTSKRFF